ncbi:MAG TPA: ribosome-associated translation inhibitor RaiA [Bradyrhizobium sp.]|nr:ribosome-associated translation inhibitor RaiA [Bradyrhizobium sp.]
MTFRVSGKNIDIGEALRERVSTRVAEAVDKYFHGGYSGHVTVGKEAFGFRTECVVHLDSGTMLQSDAMAGDAYSSADQAAERIEKRLRRYKTRLKDRHEARTNGRHAEAMAHNIDAPSYVIEAPNEETDESTAFNPVIIAETTTVLRSMSVSDAVLELDMTGVPVVVFRHAGHGRINLVYRRPDGHVGWIDPPALDNSSH